MMCHAIIFGGALNKSVCGHSVACGSGRPRTFRGHWYTSMFIHYRPVEYNLKPPAERLELVGKRGRVGLGGGA